MLCFFLSLVYLKDLLNFVCIRVLSSSSSSYPMKHFEKMPETLGTNGEYLQATFKTMAVLENCKQKLVNCLQFFVQKCNRLITISRNHYFSLVVHKIVRFLRQYILFIYSIN